MRAWQDALSRILVGALLFVAAYLSVATSYRPHPTHRPIYMSWRKFRSAVKVLPPQAIGKHGKIYTWGPVLFVSEPGQGIHVIDNERPENPRQVAFVRIPGSTDLAVRAGYLYADSFMDLVILEVSTSPISVRYLRREKDVVPYDASSAMQQGRRFFPTEVNPRKGVVVGWEALITEARP